MTKEITYPADCLTDEDRLEYLYAAQEKLRLEHNATGAAFRAKEITQPEWDKYRRGEFRAASKRIGYALAVLRETLGWSTLPPDDPTLQEITQTKEDFKQSARWPVNLNDFKEVVEAIPCLDPLEDLTEYTEVDPNNRYTVTANKVAVSSLPKNEDAYVYYDKGAGYFDGNFEHLLEVYTDSTSQNYSCFVPWMLANDLNDEKGLDDAGKSFLDINIQACGVEADRKIRLRECDSGTVYEDYYLYSYDTLYYLTTARDEGVGTYGTLYCYIYSDASRETLLDTLSVTLHTSKKDFRYIYAANSRNEAVIWAYTGYMQDLDLQEGGVEYFGCIV